MVAMLGAFVFAGLANADEHWNTDLRGVGVDLTGSMRLGWLDGSFGGWHGETYNITVHQNFTAAVPPEITDGTYDADFGGLARVDEKIVAFNGMVMTENGTFRAEFAVPNVYTDVPTGGFPAWGNLTLVISELTKPPVVGICECVKVMGRVTDYGGSPAFGHLNADAKISITNSTTNLENSSRVHLFWAPVNETASVNDRNAAPENFTYSFYAARLINTAVVALNYSGNDFYVSGLWNVLNVTFSFHGTSPWDFQKTATYAEQNVTGDLRVYNGWKNFTASISGFKDVNGLVKYFLAHAKAIFDGDIFGRGRVDIYDLVYVARRIGSTAGDPHWGGPSNFDETERADLNFDFHVDVYDLVTVATEIGQTS
jgi:hypothetical protein